MSASRRRTAAVLMLVDFVLPIGLYYGLRAAGVGYVASLVVSSLVPGTGMVVTLVRERRLDSVGLFMTGLMLLSAALSFVGNDPRLLLLKGALLMVVAGGWFLATARGPSPLALRFSRPLLEGRTGDRRASWDELWETSPRFRRIWRVSTCVWGIGALADAAVRAVVALTLPIDLAVGLGGAQYAIFSVLMLVIMNVYQAYAGLHDPRSALYRPLRDGAGETGESAPGPVPHRGPGDVPHEPAGSVPGPVTRPPAAAGTAAGPHGPADVR
ncbi:VC0807 family protein [Streptosporangium longisporum]|uniref:Intracellular septation protein A n=1 Tax=Streptosporangium longisporum TaxID=46187 RepID=A0ABP6LHF9_9ACTN